MKRQAAVLVFARVANYGVMLLSPLFLVRLLTVEQFGEYREFMLYAGVLQWIAGFSINDSLLYFVALSPERVRAWIRSSTLLVAVVSGVLVALLLGVDAAMDGSLLGWFALPLAIYVLAFSNFDFWEGWYLAGGRTTAVLVYSTVRLAVRMAAVVTAAAIWRDVQVIVWVLVATEVLRMAGSIFLWRRWDRGASGAGVLASAREQWRFCLSTGLSRLVIMVNRNVGALLIARLLGPVALARFTVATYPEPAVSAVSKSAYLVAMPELVRRRRVEGNAGLDVWKRTASWVCLGVFPLLAFVLMTAPELILVAFGPDYVVAAPLLQAFLLVMARNCIDFATPLQAIGETRSILYCNAVALLVNAVALALLMPTMGALGVVLAFALAMLVEPVLLGPLVARRYEQPVWRLLHWKELARILMAAAAAAVTIGSIRSLGLAPLVFLATAGGTSAASYLIVLMLLRSECLARIFQITRLRLARGARHAM